MHVTIVGGWSDDPAANAAWTLDVHDRAKFVEACRSIGERLAARGHSIVVGSDAENAADRYVVQGFVARCKGRDPQRPLVHLIQGIHSEHDLFGAERHAEDTRSLFTGRFLSATGPRPRAAEKILSIREADALVAIGGLQDTYTAGVAALVARKPVVPIASFGGAARELWDASRLLRDVEDDADFNQLGDGVWSPAVLDAAFRYSKLDRPAVFLASSGKARALAEELRGHVEALGLEVIHWQRDFRKRRVILEEIRASAFSCKYAIILLTPDDPLAGTVDAWAPRDNVVFEMGYFISAVGSERTLIVVQPPAKVLADYGGYIFVSLPPDAPVSSIVPDLRKFFADDVPDENGGGESLGIDVAGSRH